MDAVQTVLNALLVDIKKWKWEHNLEMRNKSKKILWTDPAWFQRNFIRASDKPNQLDSNSDTAIGAGSK